MGLLHEMQNITDYTEREHDICQYILQHPEEVASLSSRKLGELTFTSAATVTRFCQKLGCKGYPDFKLRFLSELKYHDTPEKEEEISISEKESVVTMLRKVEETYKRAIQETKDMLSLEQMMRIRKLVRQAEYIDFYVYDANVALAMYARNLLFHSGKVANVYSETNIQELNALVSREKHLAIIISRTGENARLVEVAKTLKRSKTKTIIMISHRLANVVKANCIYALDNGKVIESGSHEELLNNHNIYYRLWSKQKELETYGIGGINNE